MKIIISHDVDHINLTEHLLDLYIPKLFYRETLKLIKRKISLIEWVKRLSFRMKFRINNVDQIMKFDQQLGVKSTFFIAVNRGLSLSYSKKSGKIIASTISNNNFDVGLHGQEYQLLDKMKYEYDEYITYLPHDYPSIRMHYVRFDDFTFHNLSQLSYIYDSTEFDKRSGYTIKNPYKVNGMWEFPVTIMDVYLPEDFEKAKDVTLDIIKKAIEADLEFISVLFHDHFFSTSYLAYYNWYSWIINYFKDNGFEFISYKEAIKELEKKQNQNKEG